jgi:hypothetical protein
MQGDRCAPMAWLNENVLTSFRLFAEYPYQLRLRMTIASSANLLLE